jgi:hypothetical protein
LTHRFKTPDGHGEPDAVTALGDHVAIQTLSGGDKLVPAPAESTGPPGPTPA